MARRAALTLLAVLVVANTDRGSAVPPALTGADANNVCVDGAGDAVGELDVELGEGVLCVDGGVGQVTDSGGLNDVADGEALDGLVLGDGTSAVAAADKADVAAAVLVAASVLGEREKRRIKRRG